MPSTTLRVDAMARVVAEQALQIVPQSRTTLWRLDPDDGRLHCLVFLRNGVLEIIQLREIAVLKRLHLMINGAFAIA